MSATMKAVRMHRYGDPRVLVYEDAPRPAPGPGEILVRVHASGVNPVDWKVREGLLRGLQEHRLPLIPGWDVSGVVEEVGERPLERDLQTLREPFERPTFGRSRRQQLEIVGAAQHEPRARRDDRQQLVAHERQHARMADEEAFHEFARGEKRLRIRDLVGVRPHRGVRRAGELGVPEALSGRHLAADLVGQVADVVGCADQVDDGEVDLDEVREVAELEEPAQLVGVARHRAGVARGQLGHDPGRGGPDVVDVQLGLGEAGDEVGGRHAPECGTDLTGAGK